MIYKLVNIGRYKVSRTVELVDEERLVDEVRKHLFSRDVGILWNDDAERGDVIVGGLRKVGEVFRMPS